MMEYVRPKDVQEVLEIIQDRRVYIFAGGTDLMIRKRQWQGAERRFDKPVVFIAHLPELKGIFEGENHYEIMACTSQAELADSLILPPYIREPIAKMATPSIRNSATIGGNIVNAASVGDSIPVFFVLDAVLVLRNSQASRHVRIQDFIQGKYKTDLKSNEILEKIILPKVDYDGFFYRKTGLRKASILSKVSVYSLVRYDKGDLMDFRVAIGAVNDRPIRSRSAEEKFLEARDPLLLIESIHDMMDGRDDKRSTKAYREEIASRLILQSLDKLIKD